MAKRKKSVEEVKPSEIARLLKQIEVLKTQTQARGQVFASVDKDSLTEAYALGEPFIRSARWDSTVTPGSTAHYVADVYNPSDSQWAVIVTMFFGLGTIFDVPQAWIGRDKRWPEFSSDTIIGPTTPAEISFRYTVPDVPYGGYNGNSVLWITDRFVGGGAVHPIKISGRLLDRGSFYVTVARFHPPPPVID